MDTPIINRDDVAALERQLMAELAWFEQGRSTWAALVALDEQLATTSDPKALLAFANHDGNLAQLLGQVDATLALEGFDGSEVIATEGLLSSLREAAAIVRQALTGRAVRNYGEKDFDRAWRATGDYRKQVQAKVGEMLHDLEHGNHNPNWFNSVTYYSVPPAKLVLAALNAAIASEAAAKKIASMTLPTTEEEARHYYRAINDLLVPHKQFWRFTITDDGRVRIASNYAEHYASIDDDEDMGYWGSVGDVMRHHAKDTTLAEMGYTGPQVLSDILRHAIKAANGDAIFLAIREAVRHGIDARHKLEADGKKKEAVILGYATTALWQIGRLLLLKASLDAVQFSVIVVWNIYSRITGRAVERHRIRQEQAERDARDRELEDLRERERQRRQRGEE